MNFASNSPLDIPFSLDQILRKLDSEQRYRTNSPDFEYDYHNTLKLKEKIGNHSYCAENLIYYPELAKSIRNLKKASYKAIIKMDTVTATKHQGIESLIASLTALKQKIDVFRTEKAYLDSQFNNLVMLYGQKKEIPIYNGAKPYICKHNISNYRCHQIFRVKLSGVNYYINFRRKKFGDKSHLYELNENMLFREYFDKATKANLPFERNVTINFLGGIVNTPILIFRVIKKWGQKGKVYYFDLYQLALFTRKADYIAAASKYTNNHYIQLLRE